MKKDSIYLSALKDLYQRYKTVWCEVWAIRDKLDPPKREEDERAFLPAHLELVETPISAAPKWTARLIMAFAVLALLWAIIGKMDIVAVAQGKTTLGGRSKTIQPLETSVVKSILVKDGQHVEKDQVLMELSGIGSDSDYERSVAALQAAHLSKWRSVVLLNALEQKTPVPKIDIFSDIKNPQKALSQLNVSNQILLQTQELVINQYQSWYAKDQQLQSMKAAREAELNSVQAQIVKLKGLTQIEQQRTQDYKKLLDKNFMSKHMYYEQQSKLIQNQNDLASQKSKLIEIKETIRQADEEQQLNTQTLMRDTLDLLRQSDEQIAQLNAETEKALQRQTLMTLKSPVAGTVQQLSIHTVGGVVTAAQPIMVIVPDEDKLEVEAMVLNKDIGFVKAGQKVAIKVESFPYTRYGYINGTVKSISFDAIENEQLGLVYAAKIEPERDFLNIDGAKIKLTAGMNVTGEIKTGKRRVIDYLLSPLKTKVDESLKER